MAAYSIVKLSELEGAKRIDAEYYKPYFFDLEKKIKNKKWSYLKDLLIFNRRGIQPKYSEKPTKYRAVISQNILEDFLDTENLPFVTEEFFRTPQTQKIRIRQFDILIYTTGANIGRTNIFFQKNMEAMASNHVNILRVDPKKISQIYLGLFLQSKIGRDWTDRWASGSDQEEIYPEDFNKFLIFIPSEDIQNYFAEILLKCFDLIEKSNKIYSNAENLLLEKLGLKDSNLHYKKTYTANLSDAFSAHRMDAEYFQPAYEEIIKKLKENNVELELLRKFIVDIKKGVEPGSENYQDYGKPFIRVSNLSVNGFIDRDQKYLSEELYQQLKETYEPNKGDFLLTKDATPGIAYVVKEHIEGIISSGILKIKINDNEIDKEYLALCINSLIGKMQVEQEGGGSVIIHMKPEQIKRLKVPILTFETQKKIASLVQQSHEARRKAKELLEVAKRAVEIAIERGEKESLKFINSKV